MNIGIIGAGYWGPNLIRNFSAMDDVAVTAVADLRPERLDFIRRRYPAIPLVDLNDDTDDGFTRVIYDAAGPG